MCDLWYEKVCPEASQPVLILGAARLKSFQSGHSECFPGEAGGVVDLEAELELAPLLPCCLEGPQTQDQIMTPLTGLPLFLLEASSSVD